MERNKNNNRASKKVQSHVGSEFFALGTKSNREEKKAIALKPSCSLDRKRESSGINPMPKKVKLISNITTGLSNDLWEQMTIECETLELINSISKAFLLKDQETIIKLICGSIRNLSMCYSRQKVDTILYIEILYLAKLYSNCFRDDNVTSALLSILRRDPNVRNRHNSYSHAIAANLLTSTHNESQQWPEAFLKIYVDDAINERIWVDDSLCNPFTLNITSAFHTSFNLKKLTHMDISAIAVQHRDLAISAYNTEEDNLEFVSQYSQLNSTASVNLLELGSETNMIFENKFSQNEQFVEKFVADAIREQFNKRQQQDCYNRNFLKFLCTVTGICEVRLLCISRLELWLHNAKLAKLAQNLLAHICLNIRTKNLKDHEVLVMLIKMRLKTKPLINFYLQCLREMINQQPETLSVVLKLVVQNELSNTRNPNNMGMLASMFQTAPVESAKYLAEIYKEFLLQRDDYLRTLRVFLRELVRMLRFDISIEQFCHSFLHERIDLTKQIELSEFKERIFFSTVDLICLCMFLTVSPQVREASVSVRINRDAKNLQILKKFYSQMGKIQLDGVSWMYEIAPTVFNLHNVDLSQALHKILLLEPPEQYSRCDNWPTEPERATLLKIISDTPIQEETLLRIILIGITKEIPFSIQDTFDIIILVIKRASSMRIHNYPALQTSKLDIIDFLFSMAEYHPPDNIQLPIDYEPPKLAITALYWKAWIIMLMISAHNPSHFGAFCWDNYPTIKMLIEMCITNQFLEHFMSKDEQQIQSIERESILEYESYLAAQTSQTVITEENAILLSQLTLLDPMGPARKAPSVVLEQLKYLNKSLKLGHLLCHSRKPDMLLDIIQRQGTTQSMPWLSDLVQNSEGELSHLPVQCLCEFLLFNASNINEDNSRIAELVTYLKNLVLLPDSSKQAVCEVLDYIFRRLSSTMKLTRTAAQKALKIIFVYLGETDIWLLRSIPASPHFNNILPFLIPQLRAACQIENSPNLIMSYIQFIATHTLNDIVPDMLHHIVDMAQLIVERSTMMQYIIPSLDVQYFENETNGGLWENRFQTLKCLFVMFNNYIIKLREQREVYQWHEVTDLLMVKFDDGVELPLSLNVIHAFIILLTHTNSKMSEIGPILEYWFPSDSVTPSAFLLNSNEPVQLLPDWLKLRMIRSPLDKLIETALHGLTPDQIVLFVQNFGTPVNSMSKLLALLDHAVIERYDDVKNAILNKAYLAHLIEIQQARGAKNGHLTVQALGLNSHCETVLDSSKIINQMLQLVKITKFSRITHTSTIDLNVKEIDELIQVLFKSLNLNTFANNRIRLLKKAFTKETRLLSASLNSFVTILKKYIEKTGMLDFLNMHICSFLKVIFSCCFNFDDDRKCIVHVSENLYETLLGCSELSISNTKRLLFSKITLLNILKGAPSRKKTTSPDKSLQRKKFSVTNFFEINFINTAVTDFLIYRNGRLVDWFSEINPQLLFGNNDLQVNFLFSKSCSEFRFYLLSLLCHETSWNTLNSVLCHILHIPGSNHDFSATLSFMEAIMLNPKLWLGKKNINWQRSKYRLTLNDAELATFSYFVLKEEEMQCVTITHKSESTLCSRMNLLYKLTDKESSELTRLIKSVANNYCMKSLKLKVLYQIYLMYPAIKLDIENYTKSNAVDIKFMKGWKADKIINYLITCLGNLFFKKDFDALSSDTELLMRKLAASHPLLFMRQLGVLASHIQGKTQFNIRALREEYHFHRLMQILRTLELLQPLVYNNVYKDDVHTILECYFTLLKNHDSSRELYSILIKFVEILQAYLAVNPKNAILFIDQHYYVLAALREKFNSVVQLHNLVQNLSFLQQKKQPAEIFTNNEKTKGFVFEERTEYKTCKIYVPLSTENDLFEFNANFSYSDVNIGSYLMSPHIFNLIKVIKSSSSEDTILAPLREIESITSRRIVFLNEIFERLLELIFSPSAQIRSIAYILLVRYLKHNPGRPDINRSTSNVYIQSLRDENPSVAASAADNLVEMSLLLQESAIDFLISSFCLGIKTHINTSIQIKRVLQTLLLQHGY